MRAVLPPQHHVAQPADCLHYSVSHTKNCYGTPWLRRTCETKENGDNREGSRFGSSEWVIERVLPRLSTVCWQRHSRVMGDLGECGGGQRRREMKMKEKSSGWEEDGETQSSFIFWYLVGYGRTVNCEGNCYSVENILKKLFEKGTVTFKHINGADQIGWN